MQTGAVDEIGPYGVQEAICIWGVTRNTIFTVTHEARVEGKTLMGSRNRGKGRVVLSMLF